MTTSRTRTFVYWLLPVLPWAGAAIFLIVILLAWKAKAARIEDYRTGKTP